MVETAFADLPDDDPDLAGALDVCARWRSSTSRSRTGPTTRTSTPTEQLAEAVVALLDERGELDDGRNLVSSFHLPDRRPRPRAGPGPGHRPGCSGWSRTPARSIDKAAERGHVAVHPHHAFVNEDFVARAHAAGLAVNTWTCDDPDRIRWLADVGVDAVVHQRPRRRRSQRARPLSAALATERSADGHDQVEDLGLVA